MPPDTGRTCGAVAVDGRVLPAPALPCVSGIRRRNRGTPRARPPAFPRERGRRLPAAPVPTLRPRTFPRERPGLPPAPPRRRAAPPDTGRRPSPGRVRPPGGLRHRPDGVRLPLREGRFFRVGRRVPGCLFRAGRRVGRFPFPAAGRRRPPPRLVARRLQRPPQRGPDLRRQTPADNHHPVLIHPRSQSPVRGPPPVLRLLHVAVDAPPRPGDPFHVRRRARQRHVEQGLLVLKRGHPRDRPHLRVGDLAAAHGVAQLRQRSEGPRHADVLAGRPRREPGPPAQPVRARQATVPALLLVELADEDEQLVGGGLDAGGQLGDAVAEPCELRAAVAGRGRRLAGRRLVGGLDGRRRMRAGCRRGGVVFSKHEPL